MAEPRTVAVIGGGITGLSAALHAARAGHHVHLFEATAKLGGKIAEVELAGRVVPTGPDAFLARRPEMIELAQSLGLGDQLTTPAAGSARIFRNGLLHPLPPNVLGIPATSELSTPVLSADGIARAHADLTAADDRPAGDESVGDLVRRRLGDEVLEYLVDPLLGGINAGDSDRLSITDGVPQIANLRDKHASLLTAAANTLAAAPPDPGPVFHGIDGGLNRLVDAAQVELGERSVKLHLGHPAAVSQRAGGWLVLAEEQVEVDDVIITVPASVTAGLINDFAPSAGQALESIDYSSVALIALILPPGSIDIDHSISGVLIPRLCGHLVTAVSFASHKWPELAGDDGSQVLRVSVGRRTDTRFLDLSDHELLAEVHSDLQAVFDCSFDISASIVTRWSRSLPQYDVDHRQTIAAVDAELTGFTGLYVTGAWRSGLGLPASSGSGIAAAQQLSIAT